MRRIVFLAAALVFALSACSTPTGGPATPGGSGTIPTTPLDLGNWRTASEAATLSAFQQQVTGRYGVGLALSAVAADLRRSEFACALAPRAPDGRGDPPAQICRRTASSSGCTHTWQVHLFDVSGDQRLTRTRSLYDRSCNSDGLLGGPG